MPQSTQLSSANPASLTLRRALVTGGARGIGAAIVAELRARGVQVAAPARAQLDLASPASIEAFVAGLGGLAPCGLAPCGLAPFDILVNNAGINVLAELEAIDEGSWAAMVQLNLSAPRRLMQALAPGMKSRQWGRIVNVASIFGVVSREGRGAYSATKAGLIGLTRAAALELGPHNVLVNALCPGYVETDLTRANNSPAQLEALAAQIPLRRLAAPEEIARAVAFLCSEDSSYFTGQALLLDGGFTTR